MRVLHLLLLPEPAYWPKISLFDSAPCLDEGHKTDIFLQSQSETTSCLPLRPFCPREFSVMIKMLLICVVPQGSHSPHVATELLTCGLLD